MTENQYKSGGTSMNPTALSSSRPTLSFLELLDRTFRVYRQHFSKYVGVCAAFLVPISLVQLVVNISNFSSLAGLSRTNRNSEAAALSALCGATGILLVLSIIQVVMVNGSVTYMASENYLGREVPISEALRTTWHRSRNLGCGYAVFYVVLLAFGTGVGIVGAFCQPLFAALGILVYIGIATYAFLAPVLMLENVSVSQGVNRAWVLGKARFWTSFFLIAAIGIIGYVISLAFGSVAEVIALTVMRSTSQIIVQVISEVLNTGIQIFLTPVLPIGLTLLYHDTRNRLEGLDFALQALGKPDARPSDVASPELRLGLNSRDWLNIAIIVGVSIVIVIVAGALIQSLISSFVPSVPAR